MSTLTLVRHAHVDTGGRLCGCYDVPLSARGRRQAAWAAAGSRHITRPDALYTSPLLRARDLACALGLAWQIDPVVVDGMREIDCGSLEGMELERLQRQHRDLWWRNLAQQDDDFSWPGGESYRTFRSRIRAACNAIATRHAGGQVIVVTHAGVIAQILGIVRGRPPAVWEQDRPDPLTATAVTWRDGAPRTIVSFNDPDWFRAVRPSGG